MVNTMVPMSKADHLLRKEGIEMSDIACTNLRQPGKQNDRVDKAVAKLKKKDNLFSKNKWINEAIKEKLARG